MNPFGRIEIGMSGTHMAVVTDELTVGHFVPGMPAVYGTPLMIMLMEMAAGNTIWTALPPGWVSVGVDVNIRHLAATPVGRTVIATASVTAIGDRLVTFRVQAHDGVNTIGEGTHTRAPVELERFRRRLAAG